LAAPTLKGCWVTRACGAILESNKQIVLLGGHLFKHALIVLFISHLNGGFPHLIGFGFF
jgi:hypothetical protein